MSAHSSQSSDDSDDVRLTQGQQHNFYVHPFDDDEDKPDDLLTALKTTPLQATGNSTQGVGDETWRSAWTNEINATTAEMDLLDSQVETENQLILGYEEVGRKLAAAKKALPSNYDEKPADRKAEMLETIKNFLVENPEIVPDLQSAGMDLGAPGRESVEGARVALEEAQSALSESTQNAANLQQKVEGLEWELHKRQDKGPDDNDFRLNQETQRHLTIFKDLGQRLLQFEDGDQMIEEMSDAEIESVVAFSRRLHAGNIQRSGRKWLEAIHRLTSPSETDLSARDQAAWLFVKSHTPSGHSLADVYALATKMQDSTPETLSIALAFLQGFLRHRCRTVELANEQCSTARAFIILRAIELFLDYIGHVALRQDVSVVFDSLKPFLDAACEKSRLTRGLVTWLDATFHGQATTLVSTLANIARNDQYCFKIDDRTLWVESENLVLIDGDVHYIRPTQFRMMATMNGWRLVVDDYPLPGNQWFSSHIGFTVEGYHVVDMALSVPAERMEEGNPPVSITAAELQLVDN